jgi:hypothetical protein
MEEGEPPELEALYLTLEDVLELYGLFVGGGCTEAASDTC